MHQSIDSLRERSDADLIERHHGEPTPQQQADWQAAYHESLADSSAALDFLHGQNVDTVVYEKTMEVMAECEQSQVGFSTRVFGACINKWRKEIATAYANKQCPEAAQ